MTFQVTLVVETEDYTKIEEVEEEIRENVQAYDDFGVTSITVTKL